MMHLFRIPVSFALSLCFLDLVAFAQASGVMLKPPVVNPRPSSEYFSAMRESSVVVPVYIWGNVREPGIHYLPKDYSLTDAVSSAGGPTDSADLSSVRLVRSGEVTYVDLLADSSSKAISAKDRIFVERSFKSDLPLIFSGISTLLTVATFVLVLSDRKK